MTIQQTTDKQLAALQHAIQQAMLQSSAGSGCSAVSPPVAQQQLHLTVSSVPSPDPVVASAPTVAVSHACTLSDDDLSAIIDQLKHEISYPPAGYTSAQAEAAKSQLKQHFLQRAARTRSRNLNVIRTS